MGPGLAPAVLVVGGSHVCREGGGCGVGSVPDTGPRHRSWENLGRGLNTILKVGAGPKHMFKMGYAGGSIQGIISSVCGGRVL